MLIGDNREQFEKFLIRLITRGRKLYLGRGPINTSVLMRKNYLIIEKTNFMAFAPTNFTEKELWDCAEYIESIYDKKVYPALIQMIEVVTGLKIVGSCATMVPQTDTRVNILIADKPWEQAELRATLDSLDIDKIAESVFLGK